MGDVLLQGVSVQVCSSFVELGDCCEWVSIGFGPSPYRDSVFRTSASISSDSRQPSRSVDNVPDFIIYIVGIQPVFGLHSQVCSRGALYSLCEQLCG